MEKMKKWSRIKGEYWECIVFLNTGMVILMSLIKKGDF